MAAGRGGLRQHADLGDQAAQDLRRFPLHPRFLKDLGQVRDLLAIEVGQARMEPQGRGLGRILEKRREFSLPAFQSRHLRFHRRMIHAVLDGREHAGDLLLDLLQRALRIILRAAAVACGGVERLAVFLDKHRDQIGVQELLAQAVQHPRGNPPRG
ncbi:hypothetical protein [Paracoccus yeei]|uniref:hypothetical protein n=1 Tax=Paracoccus yeei TaxID=147645 RepID=UPI003BF89C94